MPYRALPIVSGEIYHVFNRSVARQPIFTHKADYERMLQLIDFYRFARPHLRFSHYHRLQLEQRASFLKNLYTSLQHVEIMTFCVMPNHLHFLLKETAKNGITTFMRNLQNSYAKYFNTKRERSGAVFQAMFKNVHIESDEQFIHVARYIHINPLTSFLVKNAADLGTYPWSSYIDYIGKHARSFVSTTELLSHFRTKEKLKTFTLDQVDYQGDLEKVKHLLPE